MRCKTCQDTGVVPPSIEAKIMVCRFPPPMMVGFITEGEPVDMLCACSKTPNERMTETRDKIAQALAEWGQHTPEWFHYQFANEVMRDCKLAMYHYQNSINKNFDPPPMPEADEDGNVLV